MISARKKKLIVKKLHAYFVSLDRIPTEAEYKVIGNVPFTSAQLTSYLGGYNRAVMFVKTYYPQWKEVPKVVEAAPKINMEALEQEDDVE